MVKYIPKQGDIVYFDLNPVKGHEQGGYRPAVVLSTNKFNKFNNMILCCPITSNNKFFPSHYELQKPKKIKGSVLCEHIRSIDFDERNVEFVEKVSSFDFNNIMSLFLTFFDEKL